MGRLKDLQANTVQVLLEQYVHIVTGVRKVGKTTLFRDLVRAKYGEMNKGLLLGFEKGYQALDGLFAEAMKDWADYESILSELIADRASLPYRLICIDTIDEMVLMAEREAIRFYNSRVEPSKRAKTINEAGAYGKGKQYAKQLIRDSINKLLKSGYGIFFIAHSKEKSLKEKDGTEYTQLTCSLTNDYTDIFMDMADLITFLTVERQIENEQITSKQVFMNFRSDGSIDCGGRFKGLPDKVEWGAENYLTVFENAVKASMLTPPDDLEAIKKEQEEKFEAQAQKNIEEILDLPNAIKEIKRLMKEKLKSKTIDNAFIIEVLSNNGFNTPDEVDDIKIAKKIIEAFERI